MVIIAVNNKSPQSGFPQPVFPNTSAHLLSILELVLQTKTKYLHSITSARNPADSQYERVTQEFTRQQVNQCRISKKVVQPVSISVWIVQLSWRCGVSALPLLLYSLSLSLSQPPDSRTLPTSLLPETATSPLIGRGPPTLEPHFLRESTWWPYFSAESGLK